MQLPLNQPVLIVGATSAIAKAIAQQLAERGQNLLLAARNTASLEQEAQDLRLRFNITVKTYAFDADQLDTHDDFSASVIAEKPAGLIVAFGDTMDLDMTEGSTEKTLQNIYRNYAGVVTITDRLSEFFRARKSGFIAGISSISGDRGRKKNYHYGAAKAGMSVYLDGLRNACFNDKVHVLTIKPGFVDTPMTFGKVDSPLTAKPAYVAKTIIRAIEKEKNTLYTPWFWRWIMLVIKCIPEVLFKRMSL
ncbi:MAG: short-chain dehydrogenase [marine bacterium B5-7]|nr:MAG: short-chain dehydrogenase [marine bacterium B5-7]